MKATEWNVGRSTGLSRITKEIFDGYAKSGIQAMEVSTSLPVNLKEVDWNSIKRYSRDSGVELWSFHIPFAPFEEINIATLDTSLRRKTVETFTEYLKVAGELGVKTAVIHPSGEPNKPEERQDLMESAKECFVKLVDRASEYGLVLSVEDLPRTCLGNCSKEIKELISVDDRLRVCFDTNHLLDENNIDFVRAVGDRIFTLHVSDYDFRNERHWLPYEGKNDWIGIVTALEEAGYCGPFMYELGNEAPKSIIRRTLTDEDFVNNYKACVNKVKAEVIGTPNEEVCASNSYYKIPVIR